MDAGLDTDRLMGRDTDFHVIKGGNSMLDFGAVRLDFGPSMMIGFSLFVMIAFYGFILYFLFSVLRFVKNKTENDRTLNQKLDLLIDRLKNRDTDSR